MGRADKPEIKDWLVVMGLVAVIVVIVIDIVVVRSRNKTLRAEIEKASEEAQVRMEKAEKDAVGKIALLEQKIRVCEEKVVQAKKNAAKVESDYIEKMNSQRADFQSKMREQQGIAQRQKESYEERIRVMRDDFNRKFDDYRDMMKSAQMASNVQRKHSTDDVQRGGQSDQESTAKANMSQKERKYLYNKNLTEIKKLREEHPGCVIVPVQDQARILETRFADAKQKKYCAKGRITYVRELFHCTNCNYDFGINHGSGCCEVSRKRSYMEWSARYRAAEKAAQIKDRIDELLEENASLKSGLW